MELAKPIANCLFIPVPFLPVITVFLCSWLMLGDLPFDDDDDDDDGGGGVMTPVYNYAPSGA